MGPQLKRLKRAAYARHHYTVAMHSLESGARWYGRWQALKAVGWGLPANGTAASAMRVLLRSFVPSPVIAFIHRHNYNDETLPVNGVTLDAVLGGAAVPEA
jgi:hypothetical protein